MGPKVPDVVSYSDWRPSGQANGKQTNAVVDSPSTIPTKKRKLADIEERQINGASRVRNLIVRREPVGIIWDSTDYSCAYDATFTILSNLWSDNSVRWSDCFAHLGDELGRSGRGLAHYADGALSIERVRDISRRRLHNQRPDYFPYGPNGSSIDRLAMALLPSKYFATGVHACTSCGHMDGRSYAMLEPFLTAGLNAERDYPVGVRIQDWLNSYLSKGRIACTSCRSRGIATRMTMRSKVMSVPPLFIFDITHHRIVFDRELVLDIGGAPARMKLRGVIYGGQAHFTCRYIDSEGGMWFHDGITTANKCLADVKLSSVENLLDLHRCGEKIAVAVVYVRDL
ncbi:hypothetical protein B0H16DRAFT_1319457 [Mycena metata]|uniref:Uncharacterized protein n=1 Tax=Mycena metata TaxID=1033252 RepID=A0AAD7N6T5_9AGAR|nr:hypothetical protein B0H16DRAFT_1319457 [Mycena metata]